MKSSYGRMAAWQDGDPRLTNGVLVVLGLVLVALAHQFTVEIGHFVIGFDKTSLTSVLIYLLAVLVVRTQPVNRTTLKIIIGISVPLFAVTYLTDPYLSSDIYRYVWDGMVQHHFVNPYRYVPGNPVLAYLRAPNQDIFDNINRRDYAPTIYPPVAQMVYWLATYFAPTVAAMKLLMLGFVALSAWALADILKRLGRSTTDLLILLWCPLLVWEIGCAGHVDAVVCGFVSLALLFRLRQQPWWCGLFLGMAVMTKFYPLLLLPALYQRRDWKMPTTVAAVCVAGYALYSSVGWQVLGFMSGYQKEEGIDSGTRFFLLDFAHHLPGLASLPKQVFTAFSAVVLATLVLWAWRFATPERFVRGVRKHLGMGEALVENQVRNRVKDSPRELGFTYKVPTSGAWSPDRAEVVMPAFTRAAAMLALALMLLFSPHYAWYNVWLVPFMVLVPSLPLFGYTLAFFYGYTTSLAGRPGPLMFLLNERIYGLVLVALMLHFAFRQWPVWPWLVTPARKLDDQERAGVSTLAEDALAADAQ